MREVFGRREEEGMKQWEQPAVVVALAYIS